MALDHVQGPPGWWDTANDWAWKELRQVDDNREAHWDAERYQRILDS